MHLLAHAQNLDYQSQGRLTFLSWGSRITLGLWRSLGVFPLACCSLGLLLKGRAFWSSFGMWRELKCLCARTTCWKGRAWLSMHQVRIQGDCCLLFKCFKSCCQKYYEITFAHFLLNCLCPDRSTSSFYTMSQRCEECRCICCWQSPSPDLFRGALQDLHSISQILPQIICLIMTENK